MPNENIGKIKRERVKTQKDWLFQSFFLCVFLCNFTGVNNPILNVDAVHQRAAHLVQVAAHSAGRTGAFDGGMVVVAAGTGVHGGDEHKAGGVVDGAAGTADGDAALLHRLA